MALFVLVHSPLVGMLTWAGVADALWARGIDVVTPGLHHDREAWEAGTPYWRQHVSQVVESAEGQGWSGEARAPDDPLVLVGHSGAGVLLPAIGAALSARVAAYLFCDADLPLDGRSRFELFEDASTVEAWRAAAVSEMLPPFPEAALREAIPDKAVRSQFAEDLRSTPLAVYEEGIPVPAGWPEAPVGYLGFTSGRAQYGASVRRALAEGWPFSELEGSHFQMLNDPGRVAGALVSLAGRCGVGVG